jgi:hypothetical protein
LHFSRLHFRDSLSLLVCCLTPCDARSTTAGSTTGSDPHASSYQNTVEYFRSGAV